jgi:peptidoglycan/xylan/chitin deacetylase (PgdA/CDA1 family)
MPLLSAVGRQLAFLKRPVVCIFTYHRVVESGTNNVGGHPTSPVFEAQVKALNAILPVRPLEQALRELRDGELRKSVSAITFDDGYADNYLIAAPILKKHNLSATFFVSTDHIGGSAIAGERIQTAFEHTSKRTLNLSDFGLPCFVFNNKDAAANTQSALRQIIKYFAPEHRDQVTEAIVERLDFRGEMPKMMSAEQIKKALELGMAIGSHSHRHLIMSTVDLDACRQDVLKSIAALESITGAKPSMFAYPNGRQGSDYGQQHSELLQELGFNFALTTNRGLAKAGFNAMEVPRLSPWDITRRRFQLRLLQDLYSA